MAERGLPREFLLVVACCRWPLTQDAIAAIHEAAKSDIDWPRLLRMVRRQRVAGLVHNALTMARVDLPPPIARELAEQTQAIARQNLIQLSEAIRLQGVFAFAGIAALTLKGVTLAQQAYGSIAFKHGKDIDFLVSPDHAEQAWRILERDGYELALPAKHLNAKQRRMVLTYGREIGVADRRRDSRIDLRWRLTGSPLLMSGLDPFAEPQEVALPGGAVRTLGDDVCFVYLCVHGGGHVWSRLKWLADLNALLSSKNADEIERLYRYSQACGGGYCAGLGLLLCERLLGFKTPTPLAAELHASRRLAFLTAIALDVMAGPDGETELEERRFGSTRVSLANFLLGDGVAYFAARCREMSVRLGDIIALPLPAPLHFLYPVLRLPLWLWRRVRSLGASRPRGKI